MKKKFFSLLILLALSFCLLSGCSTSPLPDGMEEEATGEAGRAIVTLLAEENYQGVVDAFQPEFREQYEVTAEKIAEVMEAISTAGPLVQIEKTLAVGGKSDTYSGNYASVLIYAEHQEAAVIYELSITPDLSLIGLSVKEK